MNLKERLDLMEKLGQYLASKSEALHEVKERAFQKNKWFTPQFIQLALDTIRLHYLDPEKLQEWVTHYRLDDHILPKTIGIVMAGNIPLVGFHDFLTVFISGHFQKIKLSEKDDVLLSHLIDVMTEWEPAVEGRVEIQDMLKGCDAYIATGSANSGRYFNYYFGKYPSVIRTNKTSVAILDGSESHEELSMLADDVYNYFGLGCRNVTQIYVPRGYNFEPLIHAFKKYDYLADETKYKNNYDYNLALLLMNNRYYMSNQSLVLVEDDQIFSPVSVLHYAYYDSLSDLQIGLNRSDKVQCVTGKGYLPFGTSQSPSLFDYADGIDTMQFLLSL